MEVVQEQDEWAAGRELGEEVPDRAKEGGLADDLADRGAEGKGLGRGGAVVVRAAVAREEFDPRTVGGVSVRS